MKKTITIFTLLFVAYFAVQGQSVRDEYFKIVGKPTIVAPTLGSYSVDFTNKQVWRSTSKTTAQWTLETDTNIIKMYLGGRDGKDGKDGINGRDGVCPSCPPTSGGGSTAETPFIYVKPYGSAATLAQAGIPTSNYTGFTVTSSDMVDWANLQQAVIDQEKTGKVIELIAKTYYVNRSVQAGKYQSFVVIRGNYAKIATTNSTAFAVLGRPSPTDNGDANVMIQSIWNIENITFTGANTQVGVEPGPTYGVEGSGSLFSQLQFNGLKEAIHTRFCLNADIIKPAFSNCVSGAIIDMGNWTGADNANSQSNNVRIYKPRWYGGGSQDAAIRYLAASGGVVDQPIIEGGGTLRVGIEFDGKASNVVKDGAIINGYHFENVNGATEAALKVRFAGGRFKHDGYFGQYSTIVADIGSASGNMEYDLTGMVYAVPKNGKLFRNANSTYTGGFNTYQGGAITNTNFKTLFEGTPVDICGGIGCGNNRYKIVETPR